MEIVRPLRFVFIPINSYTIVMSQTSSEMDHESPEGDSADRPRAPKIKQPGPFRRVGYTLFNRETRTGRFLRRLGRILLTVIGLVGLGMLVTYLLFYRPVEEQLSEARQTITQAREDLATAQKDRDLAIQQRQDADSRAEAAQDRLGTELTRIQLLRAMTSLKNAQLAIQEKNKTAAANAVTTAEGTLKQAYSRLDRINPDESASLQARFVLVRDGLERDLARALPDIELLIADLSRLDNALK